jgi:hypothetical protein
MNQAVPEHGYPVGPGSQREYREQLLPTPLGRSVFSFNRVTLLFFCHVLPSGHGDDIHSRHAQSCV